MKDSKTPTDKAHASEVSGEVEDVQIAEPYWRPDWPPSRELSDLRFNCDYLVDKVGKVLKGDDDPFIDEDPEYDAVVAREVEPVWDHYSALALHGLPALDVAFKALQNEILKLDRKVRRLKHSHIRAREYVDALLSLAPAVAGAPISDYFQNNKVFSRDAVLHSPTTQILKVLYPYWTLREKDEAKAATYEFFVEQLMKEIPDLGFRETWTWNDLRAAIINNAEREEFDRSMIVFRRKHRFFVACVLDGVRHLVRTSGRVRTYRGIDITGKAPETVRAPWIQPPGPRGNAGLEATFRAILDAIDPMERNVTITTIYRRVARPECLSATDPVNSWHNRIEQAMEKLDVATPTEDRKNKGLGPWQRVPKSSPDLQVDLLRVVATTFVGTGGAFGARKNAVKAAVAAWRDENERFLEQGV